MNTIVYGRRSNKFVEAIKIEAKGSDVNIAAHLIHDGHPHRAHLLLDN